MYFVCFNEACCCIKQETIVSAYLLLYYRKNENTSLCYPYERKDSALINGALFKKYVIMYKHKLYILINDT